MSPKWLLLFSLSIFGTFKMANGQQQSTSEVVIIDFCNRTDPSSCGDSKRGECIWLEGIGTRCRCAPGRMGPGCKRQCQNVHHSCDRWQRQGRCEWHKALDAPTPFFIDNCALSCGFCQTASKNAQKSEGPSVPPLAPMLEALAWLVGRWQTRTLGNHTDRFPAPLSGPYVEVLDIQPAAAPAFDRPSLNWSVHAWTINEEGKREEHVELGFLSLKPAREQNGFVPDGQEANDLVALEMASNTGLLLIEEGQLVGPRHLQLATHWSRRFLPTNGQDDGQISLETAQRAFVLAQPDTLEERLDYRLLARADGGSNSRRRVLKRFRKVHDYFA